MNKFYILKYYKDEHPKLALTLIASRSTNTEAVECVRKLLTERPKDTYIIASLDEVITATVDIVRS